MTQNRVDKMKYFKTAWINHRRTQEALNRIFFLSKILGVFPLDSNFNISYMGCLISTVYFIIYLALSFYILLYLDSFATRFGVEEICVIAQNISLQITNVVALVWLTGKGRSLKRVRRELEWVERVTRWHGLDWTWRPSPLETHGTLSYMVTICALNLLLNLESSELGYLTRHVTMALGIAMVALRVNQFVGFLSLLRSQSEKIMCLADSQVVLSCQESIFSIVEELNLFYGPIMVIIFVCMFVPTLYNIYGLFTLHSENFYVAWTILGILPIIHPVVSSHITVTQINKVNKMIYGRMIAHPDDEALDFHLTAKRELVFTAAGFFTLDNSLICSMIGAGTTYLVILLQYSQNPANTSTQAPTNQSIS